ncbi:hypothetical protein ACFY1P_20135 [Streptomyces sp. NPDC001407]|uniref:hypothetical protein n=1 Tax=Streptomyces sp. NPDC001407 TaxID=3364573 RepID=UPI00369A0E14
MEPQLSDWSRDLVLADSLEVLREATMRPLGGASCLAGGVERGGLEKTTVAVQRIERPGVTVVADGARPDDPLGLA